MAMSHYWNTSSVTKSKKSKMKLLQCAQCHNLTPEKDLTTKGSSRVCKYCDEGVEHPNVTERKKKEKEKPNMAMYIPPLDSEYRSRKV
jgi:NAD-dependent SIR2 family protein deacetylase